MLLGSMSAPLLEEERDRGLATLIAQTARPGRMHRPGTRTGLAADDEPVDSLEPQAIERTKQRLGADEAYRRRHVAQVVGTVHETAILDGDAHPYIGRP